MASDKGAKIIKRSKENAAETSGHQMQEKRNLESDFILFTKINLKWVTNLNVEHKIITFQKIIGENLNDHGYAHNFFITSKA